MHAVRSGERVAKRLVPPEEESRRAIHAARSADKAFDHLDKPTERLTPLVRVRDWLRSRSVDSWRDVGLLAQAPRQVVDEPERLAQQQLSLFGRRDRAIVRRLLIRCGIERLMKPRDT